MPTKVPFHRAPGQADGDAGRAYERAPARQEDKNFYSSTRWRKLRAVFLRRHPMCAAEGCRSLAAHVDHKLDRKVRPDLAFEWDNLQALCQPCHNRKRGAR